MRSSGMRVTVQVLSTRHNCLAKQLESTAHPNRPQVTLTDENASIVRLVVLSKSLYVICAIIMALLCRRAIINWFLRLKNPLISLYEL